MMGFVFMIAVLVLGALGLVRGLQIFGIVGRREPGMTPAVSPAEIERMRDALASLESRLDTLQEEQRFLERLLADRGDTPALGQGSVSEREDGEAGEARSILFDTRES